MMFFSLINKEKLKRGALYAVYLLVVLLFQDMVFSNLRIAGVRPMFSPAAAVAAGMFEGGVWGGMFGLVLGLFSDMTFTENTALFTVLFPVFGFFSGALTQFLATKRFVAYIPVAILALFITAFAQMFGVWIADSSSASWYFLRTAILQGLWSIPLALPLYFPCRAMHGGILD